MRIERLVLGLLLVAATFVAGVWYVDRRTESTPVVGGGTASAPTAPTTALAPTAPPVPLPPTTTTTTLPGLRLPLDPGPVRLAWAGDSVAYTLAPAVAAEGNARGFQVVDRSIAGCGMLRGFPADENLQPYPVSQPCDRAVPEQHTVTAASGADVITWLSTWETSNRVVDGTGYVFGTPEADAKLLELIDESAQQLMAGGARLVFVTMPPTTTGEIRPVVEEAANVRAAHLNGLLARYAAEHADRVGIVDLGSIVCPDGPPCPTTIDGIVLRPEDGGHFDAAGAAWVAPRLLDRLVGAA